MYTPICQENYEMEVMPCQEVCIEARKRCAPIMQQYGFKWPVTLSCDTLPKASDQLKTGEICAAPPDAITETSSSFEQHSKDNNNNIYKKPSTTKHSKHFPSVTMDGKALNEDIDIIAEDGNMPIIGIDIIDPQCECRCVKPFHVTEFEYHKVLNVSNCAYSCRSPALSRKADQIFMDNWITAWASGCLFLCAFTALTFLIEMERFPYPERPIFFLSLCQGMVAIGFLLRVYLGHETIACDGNILKSGTISSNSCLLNFILIYYFGMAAATWWVILSLTWVLAAVPNWSTEWIAKYSTYFHLFSWCLPLIQTILVIIFDGIDGDSLSGICYVGNTSVINLRYFVLLPLIIYFIVGVCFLIIGFLNLWGIRSSLKKLIQQLIELQN
uniref:Frizzled-4 n=1 Tax=Panagrolaimus superbus TaxID=310955 RepID=A0A914Y5B6_9BILA